MHTLTGPEEEKRHKRKEVAPAKKSGIEEISANEREKARNK